MATRPHLSRFALAVFVAASLGVPFTARAQTGVAIPGSPVGALFKQWLEAFNAADSAGLQAFSTAHLPRVTAQAHMQARRNIGGLDVLRILTDEPSHIVVATRARSTGAGMRVNVQLADGDHSQIQTFAIQAVPPGAPVEGCTTWTSATTKGTSVADVASEDAIIAALYDAISGPACQHRDWDRFRGLFAPGGRLIPTVMAGPGTLGIRAESPDDYVTSVRNSMEDYGFAEKEVSHVGESFNGVVHRFSTYESRRNVSDEKPFARGINSIQLLNDGKRWWVVTVYWASERPGTTIPEIYLKRP